MLMRTSGLMRTRAIASPMRDSIWNGGHRWAHAARRTCAIVYLCVDWNQCRNLQIITDDGPKLKSSTDDMITLYWLLHCTTVLAVSLRSDNRGWVYNALSTTLKIYSIHPSHESHEYTHIINRAAAYFTIYTRYACVGSLCCCWFLHVIYVCVAANIQTHYACELLDERQSWIKYTATHTNSTRQQQHTRNSFASARISIIIKMDINLLSQTQNTERRTETPTTTTTMPMEGREMHGHRNERHHLYHEMCPLRQLRALISICQPVNQPPFTWPFSFSVSTRSWSCLWHQPPRNILSLAPFAHSHKLLACFDALNEW